MVKLLQPSVYASWAKRKLMDNRVLLRNIEPGSVYLFLYDSNESLEFSMAPLVLPLRMSNRGFYGANLLMMPRRDLKSKVLKEYIDISGVESLRKKERDYDTLYGALRSHNILKHSLVFYTYNKIKSRVVSPPVDEVETLIRRVL
jgi:hypothetical protein